MTVTQGGSSVVVSNTLSNIAITDNGVNVNNQFTATTTGSYDIETRGSYGFALNANNYYESQNKGVNKSAAVCRINFSLPVAATITFTYINYAEASYDFGVFGNVDTALNTNYYSAGSNGATISDISYMRACNTSSYNSSSTQTLTYSNVAAGDHFIDVKFSKDDASAAYNDSLQFRISITYNSSVYAYTISNIQANHTIVVTTSGTSTTKLYAKINSTWTQFSKAYKKINGSWVEQTDLTSVFNTTTNYRKGN